MVSSSYLLSILANAAYSSLTPNVSLSDQILELSQPNRLATSQAQELAASGWTVAAAFHDSSGADAYVFKCGDQCVLAVGGTASLADFGADGLLAFGATASMNFQYTALQAKVLEWCTPQGDMPAILTPGFTTTGHSLGGYLAAAIKADPLFATQVSFTYQYNSPGVGGVFGGIAEFFSQAFGSPVPSAGVFSFHSSEGPSITAGLGKDLAKPTIIQTDWQGGITGHDMFRLSDGLAVEAYLSAVTGSQDTGLLGQIMDTSGVNFGMVPEGAIDALRRMAYGSDVSKIGDTRDGLYAAMDQALLSTLGGSSVLNLSEASATQMVSYSQSTSEQGTMARRALEALSSFGISHGVDAPKYADKPAEYWQLRAQMLERLNFFNKNELAAYNTNVPHSELNHQFQNESVYYRDAATGFEVLQDRVYGNTPFIIFAGSAGDLIDGGSYHDTIFGGQGEDEIRGGDGNDILYGDAGSDTLVGGDGADTLSGGAGDDVLDGGHGADKLIGGAGNDWLGYTTMGLGGESQDEISSVGNTYDGGLGNDVISGSRGNDIYIFRAGDGNDIIRAQGGLDQLQVPSGNAVTFTRGGGENPAGAADLLVWVNKGQPDEAYAAVVSWFTPGSTENMLDTVKVGNAIFTRETIMKAALQVKGTAIGENIFGVAGFSNVIFASAGDDYVDVAQISGFQSLDEVHGGQGNDMIVTGEGDAEVYGDTGNDNISGGTGRLVAYGGDGDDLIASHGVNSNLSGGKDNDAILAYGDNSLVYGEDGNDHLSLFGSGISASGGRGADFMYNYAGSNNTLTGGWGNDQLYDQTGGATFVYNAGDDFDTLLRAETGTTVKFTTDHMHATLSGKDLFLGIGGYGVLVSGGAQGVNPVIVELADGSRIKSSDLLAEFGDKISLWSYSGGAYSSGNIATVFDALDPMFTYAVENVGSGYQNLLSNAKQGGLSTGRNQNGEAIAHINFSSGVFSNSSDSSKKYAVNFELDGWWANGDYQFTIKSAQFNVWDLGNNLLDAVRVNNSMTETVLRKAVYSIDLAEFAHHGGIAWPTGVATDVNLQAAFPYADASPAYEPITLVGQPLIPTHLPA